MSTTKLVGEFVIRPMLDVTIAAYKTRKDEVMYGGKVILPESALRTLSIFRDLPSPILLRINAPVAQTLVDCGCLSFEGKDGEIVVPFWIFNQLKVKNKDRVQVNVLTSNPVAGQSVKFQPQDSSFFNISDCRAVLEHSLRNIDCLSEGDMLQVRYMNQTFDVLVVSTTPDKHILIVNCDLNVEFCELQPAKAVMPAEQCKVPNESVTEPIYELGHRADGKPLSPYQKKEEANQHRKRMGTRGRPDFEHKVQELDFIRTSRTDSKEQDEKEVVGGKKSRFTIKRRLVEETDDQRRPTTEQRPPKEEKMADTL